MFCYRSSIILMILKILSINYGWIQYWGISEWSKQFRLPKICFTSCNKLNFKKDHNQ